MRTHHWIAFAFLAVALCRLYLSFEREHERHLWREPYPGWCARSHEVGKYPRECNQ